MKHSGISFFSLPPAQVPTQYWNLMFPKPYWSDLLADSQRNGLDPYLVASLIRQESEFNPGRRLPRPMPTASCNSSPLSARKTPNAKA